MGSYYVFQPQFGQRWSVTLIISPLCVQMLFFRRSPSNARVSSVCRFEIFLFAMFLKSKWATMFRFTPLSYIFDYALNPALNGYGCSLEIILIHVAIIASLGMLSQVFCLPLSQRARIVGLIGDSISR